MDCLTPDWTNIPANFGSLSTVRYGGVSLTPYDDGKGGGGLNLGTHVGDDPALVKENRRRLQDMLPSSPIWLQQVHGTTVYDADNWSAEEAKDVPEADACVTTVRNRVCVIQTADCLPVLFCDAGGHVVGAAHAGWRGLAGGVLENTVNTMKDKGAGEILAWLGPAIGPSQFEVGEDVRQAFIAADPQTAVAFQDFPERKGKYLADIYKLARMVLARNGITRITGGNYCTVTEKERFYSYRRDGVTGRMASLIWLK